MGKVTDITRQKRNKTRVSIFIDGEFVTGLDAVTLAANRVHIGDELEPDELKELVRKSEVNSAFERAAGYVSSMPRSRREIERYLLDKEYERDVVRDVIARLEEYRYIDDYSYAQTYVRQKSAKYGLFRIVSELKRKGISDNIIKELTEENDDETENVLAVARKYVRSHMTPDVQKLKRFLAGRGFSWDGISGAVSTLKDEGAFDADDGDEYDDTDFR